MDRIRKLVYKFHSLPHVFRIDIAEELGLLNGKDDITSSEYPNRIIECAINKKLLNKLWDKTEEKIKLVSEKNK